MQGRKKHILLILLLLLIAICIHADDGRPELHRGKDEDYGDLTERQSE